MRIETVMIEASDGTMLQADLADVEHARGSAVLSHPHPLYGGNRYNPIIGELFRVLPAAGFDTVRFDFRGVGSSTGEHDHGDRERLDIVAAIELLESMSPDAPVWLVGYSFGALTALNVIDPRVAGWVAIAPPLVAMDRCLCDHDPRTKLVCVPEHDQFSPPPRSTEIVAAWVASELRVIPAADHFLGAAVPRLAGEIAAYLTDRTAASWASGDSGVDPLDDLGRQCLEHVERTEVVDDL